MIAYHGDPFSMPRSPPRFGGNTSLSPARTAGKTCEALKQLFANGTRIERPVSPDGFEASTQR
jgi:hypothetical protein